MVCRRAKVLRPALKLGMFKGPPELLLSVLSRAGVFVHFTHANNGVGSWFI